MAVIPIEYRLNDTALFVKVKVKKGIYALCLCFFEEATAYVLRYSRRYNNSVHSAKVQQLLSDFGFILMGDSLSYQN